MVNRARLGLSLLCIAAWGTVHGFAQVPVGSLNGVVHDPSGAVMQGTAITVTNKDTGAEHR